MKIQVASRSKVRRKFLLEYSKLLLKQLNCDKFNRDLMIISKRGLIKNHGYKGVTGVHEGLIAVGIDSGLSLQDLMLTMAHEMVHVKQIMRGTLKYHMDGDEEIVYWCGHRYDTSEMMYIDRPWEREAYSKQDILVRRIEETLLRS